MPPLVFISYARDYRSQAYTIAEFLKSRNIQVRWDKDIPRGEEWWDTILSDIQSASHFVVLLSKEWNESPYCQEEHRFAIYANCRRFYGIVDNTYDLKLDGLEDIYPINVENYADNISRLKDDLLIWITENASKLQRPDDIWEKRPPMPSDPIIDITKQLKSGEVKPGVIDQIIQQLGRLARQKRYQRDCIKLLNRLKAYGLDTDQRQDIEDILNNHSNKIEANINAPVMLKPRRHVDQIVKGIQNIITEPTAFVELSDRIEECLKLNIADFAGLQDFLDVDLPNSSLSYTYVATLIITDAEIMKRALKNNSNKYTRLSACLYETCQNFILDIVSLV